MPFQRSCIVFLTLVPLLLQLLFHFMASIGSLVRFYWSFVVLLDLNLFLHLRLLFYSLVVNFPQLGVFVLMYFDCVYPILKIFQCNVHIFFDFCDRLHLMLLLLYLNLSILFLLVLFFGDLCVQWMEFVSFLLWYYSFLLVLFYCILFCWRQVSSVRSNVSRHHRVLIVTIQFL